MDFLLPSLTYVSRVKQLEMLRSSPVPLSQIGLRELNYLLNGDLSLCIMQ